MFGLRRFDCCTTWIGTIRGAVDAFDMQVEHTPATC